MQPEMASFFCLVFYYKKLYSTLELLPVSVVLPSPFHVVIPITLPHPLPICA